MVSLHKDAFVFFFFSLRANFLLPPSPPALEVGHVACAAAQLRASRVTGVVGLHASWIVPTALIQTLQQLVSAGD